MTVKVAEVAPAATVTKDGSDSSVLLEVNATLVPPAGAGALSVTVQARAPFEERPIEGQLTDETPGATETIVMLHVAERLAPALSCTMTATVDVPAVSGVPLINPVEESTRPEGREPEVSNQL